MTGRLSLPKGALRHDARVAEGQIENLVLSYNETLDVGKDTGSPVATYAAPFPFIGKIDSVRVELR